MYGDENGCSLRIAALFWKLDNTTASGEISNEMALVGMNVYTSPIFGQNTKCSA
jgi:hypothetical protein